MGGRISDGLPEPLGVSLGADGINVAVHAGAATAVELCLFSPDGQTELERIALPGRTGAVFHGHVVGIKAGARYGLRAHGPFAPEHGQRFNPNKLLLDPHALQIDRPFVLHPSMFGYPAGDPDGLDETDSAPFMPKAMVSAAGGDIAPPTIPWAEMVIYELHVRGFTRTHPDIPEALRGTFAGLAHPAAIAHLKRLGVTTVELLPAAAWIDERHLGPLGLTNYWGYNPIAWMAPDPRVAPGGWPEVRAATQALAAAGIETILDVVFNHSGEGDELGPTVSLRGLDNAGYYRLQPDDERRYINDSGTGNGLALDRPASLRLCLDALRAWARLGGMSGFRFDLATALGRRPTGYDPQAPLLQAIGQDPDLRRLKLIAEPWDCGPGGYQLGAFPPAWGEWNDRFRDDVRSFWRGDDITPGALAWRLSGSQDLLGAKRPSRSVNFVVAHDGFTLADLTAYAAKHNEANGEQGRDGANDNRSWNNGVEGPSNDPAVVQARLADQRALLATLLLSRGAPMLPMGAELGFSQAGNNNAYAQDNAIGWLDWAKADAGLIAFTRRLIALRAAHPALRVDRFLTGRPGEGLYPDVIWRRADGQAMGDGDWNDPRGQTLTAILADGDGEAVDRLALVLHRGEGGLRIILPAARTDFVWRVAADSADPLREDVLTEDALTVTPRSVTLLVEAPAAPRRRGGVDPDAVGQLAAAAGVASDWWSVDGERHAVSVQTQLTLLAALNLPAGGSTASLSTLRDLAQDADRRPLPHALAGRVGTPTQLALAFEAGRPPYVWVSVTGEDGAALRLRASPQTCAVIALDGRDGRPGQALALALPPLSSGRYVVRREDRPDILCRLTIAPPRCHLPAALDQGRRLFGLSLQLYSLARRGDQGVGDFTTLGALGEAAAAHGAAIVTLNPFHMLFPQQRDRASPYYPSDRRFLDPLYLDLAKIPFAGPPSSSSGESTMIDYRRVWEHKARALETSFGAFGGDADFDAFIAAGGQALADFAAFQTIAERRGGPWQAWPKGLADPHAAGVAAFVAAHADRVRFHLYLQWLCERQLRAAADQARGLLLGLCRDLAVGAAPDGAEAWAQQDLTAQGVSVGAPPDPLGPEGQVWGLPPMNPLTLAAEACAPLAGLFAVNMRSAGALRIDHVMGLARQFWVPDGADGRDGAYVAFPLDQTLAELALESERARCLVIGEDLGTVPHGLRETLADQAVLSYSALPFERDGQRFRPPSEYPVLALACVSTHDLPTLAGWWAGLDIDERLALGLCHPDAAQTEKASRQADKAALLRALANAGLAPATAKADDALDAALAAAIHAYVARTASALAVIQAEDLAGERIGVNLPGTDKERPNWRRRIGPPLETLFEAPPGRAILAAVRAERP